jgi:DNA invertase Pin-like site-specific DNA recombinase
MRCAIYVRVSTEKQDTQNQLLQLREFAKASGWECACEYNETVSGSGKKARPQFDAMMLAASQKRFDVVLFWALDRLSREGISKTLGYLDSLKGWGCGWRSYSQPFLDSGNELASSIVLSVLAACAKQERITLSERTRAGLARTKAKGTILGRPVVPLDLAQVKAMRARGESLRAIAGALGCSASLLGQRLRAEGHDGLLERIADAGSAPTIG